MNFRKTLPLLTLALFSAVPALAYDFSHLHGDGYMLYCDRSPYGCNHREYHAAGPYRCVARPEYTAYDEPRFLGHGRGHTRAEAAAAALLDCEASNGWVSSNCYVSRCTR